MIETQQNSEKARTVNAATYVVASTFGVLVGIGSIDHGILECLQGTQPTPGLIVNALGPGHSLTVWKQGGEGAFTLLPNFLASGIVASMIGLAMIVWALGFIHTRNGPTVFLVLGVASFLTGGGVAQVVLFILTWGVATRIRASLAFWLWLIPSKARPLLSRLWPWMLAATTMLFLAALEIAIFGYVPGVSVLLKIAHINWTILAIALGISAASVCCGFARDAEAKPQV